MSSSSIKNSSTVAESGSSRVALQQIHGLVAHRSDGDQKRQVHPVAFQFARRLWRRLPPQPPRSGNGAHQAQVPVVQATHHALSLQLAEARRARQLARKPSLRRARGSPTTHSCTTGSAVFRLDGCCSIAQPLATRTGSRTETAHHTGAAKTRRRMRRPADRTTPFAGNPHPNYTP